jgi:DNA-binding protein YbaB
MFAEPGFEPVTVTIADLVTVRMDARFEVVEVSLPGRDVEPRQVEAALREAFNVALRQVTQRNAARLSELTARDGKTDAQTAD